MKKIFVVMLALLPVLYSCGQSGKQYGEKITEDGAKEASTVVELLKSNDSVEVKLTGTVDAVCQSKGCWMTLNVGNGKTMRVKFKDYSFFVPKDASGKTVVVEGWAYKEVVSVEHLKHLAEDNGDSEEEIAKITEPKMEYAFMAKGVIIKE